MDSFDKFETKEALIRLRNDSFAVDDLFEALGQKVEKMYTLDFIGQFRFGVGEPTYEDFDSIGLNVLEDKNG